MDFSEFLGEMSRIEALFGAKHYSNERKEMIWRRVRGFSKTRFKSICDELIGNCKTFPVVKDFDEASSRAREQEAVWAKKEMSDASDKFLAASDVQELFKMLNDKLTGKISKEEFNARMEILKRSVELHLQQNPEPCCTDGMISAIKKETGNKFIFRCHCQRGAQYQKIPLWQNNSGYEKSKTF